MPAEYVMAMIGANAAVCHDAQAVHCCGRFR